MAVSSMSTCWVVCVHAGTRGAARVDGVRYLMVDGCDFYANGFLHIHVIIIQMSVTKALLELEGDRSRKPISLFQDVLNLTHNPGISEFLLDARQVLHVFNRPSHEFIIAERSKVRDTSKSQIMTLHKAIHPST